MKPLKDILVIDLTRVLSGPYCTTQLYHLGARVIKVERPPVGDDTRMFPPFVGKEPLPFHAINSGKESISLDIKNNSEDRLVFEKLLEKADVLVENFTPGYMKSIGYDWEHVKLINPRLVYASISGFGQTGPRSKQACYDLVAQGISGVMSVTGVSVEHPVKVGTEIADMLPGLFAAIGINAALYEREKTNKGRYIDVAMLDSLVSFLPSTITPASVTHEIPVPTGNRHTLLAPFDVYHAKDLPISICVGNDNLFLKLCEVMQHPELAQDPRFISNVARVKNVEEMTGMLNRALSTQPAAYWLELFHQHGIPSGPINTIADVMNDEQLRARHMLLPFDNDFVPDAVVVGNPIKFNDCPDEKKLPRGPRLGEHTEAIKKELGF